MTWFKVDDGFYDHPKTDDLPLDAIGLWLLCGTYCARHLTDGVVSANRVARFGGSADAIDALISCGLWVDHPEGYRFNDWHDYQPTREAVMADRERERLRKAKQRESKRGPGNVPGGVPVGVPVGQRAESQRVSQVESQGVSGHPDPTRPDPTNNTNTLLIADAMSVPDSGLAFTEFWSAYPRKVGKASAKKAWAQAVKRAPANVITAACFQMANDPNLPADRSLIPHPTTWLNRDGWDDEPYPPPTPAQILADRGSRPTPIPPRFDASKLHPDNPIPMPENVRQLLRGEPA